MGVIASILLLAFPHPINAQIEHQLTIIHAPPSKFVYPEALEFELRTDAPVQMVKFFFLRQGFSDYQLRIMKKGEDGTYRYRLDTSTLTALELRYYFEIKTETGFIRYPRTAPQDVIVLEGEAREALPDPAIRPQAPFPANSALKDRLPFQLDVDSTSSYEITTHGDGMSPVHQDRRFVTDNNVKIAKHYQDKGLTLDFYSNVALSNQPLQDTDQAALTNVLLSMNYGNHELNVGDVSIQGSKFTLDVSGRRGGDYQYKADNFFVQVFDINSQQEQGWGNVAPQSQNNLYGGVMGFDALNKQFSLKTVYLAGEDNPANGSNVAGTSLVNRKGSVLSLFPQFSLFDNRLKLFGEYASSRYDKDLSDGAGMVSDDAWRAGCTFAYGYFNTGIDYNRIGRDFDSIGNQNFMLFTPDRERFDVWGGLSFATVTFNVKYCVEEDNEKKDPQLPTSLLNTVTSNISFLITSGFTINMGYQNSRQDTREEAGDGVRLQEKETDNCSLGFDYRIMPQSRIYGAAAYTRMTSETDPGTEGNTLTATLGGAFSVDDRLFISPEVCYSKTRYDLTGAGTKIYTGLVDAEFFILSETLSVSMLSSYSRTDSDTVTGSGGPDLNDDDLQVSCNLNYYLPYFSNMLKQSVLALKFGYGNTKADAKRTDAYSAALQFDFSF
ncbi:MAG: hypothetical protein V1793_04065 [Pseudomonadota bacterium]